MEVQGTRGRIHVHVWPNDDARYVALIAHGYGEHARRYDHVADTLVASGAVVYAPDHHGHGLSDGERALVDDIDRGAEDLHSAAEFAAAENPGLPTVLIGHSMGGLIATRYAQLYGSELSALVLSGPAIGANPAIIGLLDLDPIPDVPIDPMVLSRDEAVQRAYAEDPLVYHGPFLRPTLEGFVRAIEAVSAGGTLGSLPTLWIHGSEDMLVPIDSARDTIAGLRGSHFEEKVYEGARHEIFNETNRDEVLGDVVAFVDRALRSAAASAG